MKTMATQLALMLRIGQRSSNVRLLIKFAVVLAVFFVSYSVLSHLLMLLEGREYSWVTGFYWTLTTMSTLGFGDITFHSDIGRLFSIVVLLSGIVFLLVMLPFTFIQFFYAPWLEEQNKARAPRALAENVSGHVILTHFDDVAVNLIEKFNQYGIAYVIVTHALQNALDLHDRGYKVVVGELDDPQTYHRLRIDHAALVVVLNDDILGTNIVYTLREANDQVVTVVEKRSGIASRDNRYIQGSAAAREVLEQAGIAGTPSIIITTHDDNLNIYLTIYCRRLRPDAQIICRASLDRNIKTLHRAGADLVMSLSSLVTTTIINLLERQQILMLTEGLNIFQLGLSPKMVDKALQDLNVREATGCSIVAVKRQDDMMINPDPAIVLKHGDELVLIGSAEAEKKFTEKFPAVQPKNA